MKLCVIILLLSIACLPSCSSDTKEDHQTSSGVVDLVVSTRIIRALIAQNKVGTLLEDHDSSQLDLLLDNMSPAKIAFEVEVLSSTIPLVVVYYFNEHDDGDRIQQLKGLASKYEDQIKFVMVDADRLFSLAQDAEIEKFPTLIVIKDRTSIAHLEGKLDRDAIEKTLLESYL